MTVRCDVSLKKGTEAKGIGEEVSTANGKIFGPKREMVMRDLRKLTWGSW